MIHKHLGVRYVYEEDEKPKVQTCPERSRRGPKSKVEDMLTPEVLAALPSDILTNLEQATNRSDIQKMLAIIDEIRIHDAAVADALARLAHEFDYDEILECIQKHE